MCWGKMRLELTFQSVNFHLILLHMVSLPSFLSFPRDTVLSSLENKQYSAGLQKGHPPNCVGWLVLNKPTV